MQLAALAASAGPSVRPPPPGQGNRRLSEGPSKGKTSTFLASPWPGNRMANLEAKLWSGFREWLCEDCDGSAVEDLLSTSSTVAPLLQVYGEFLFRSGASLNSFRHLTPSPSAFTLTLSSARRVVGSWFQVHRFLADSQDSRGHGQPGFLVVLAKVCAGVVPGVFWHFEDRGSSSCSASRFGSHREPDVGERGAPFPPDLQAEDWPPW